MKGSDILGNRQFDDLTQLIRNAFQILSFRNTVADNRPKLQKKDTVLSKQA